MIKSKIRNLKLEIRNFKQGFTLLEMVIVIVIGALIIATVGTLIVAQINLYHTQTTTIDLSDGVARALDAVQQTVAEAKAVVANRTFAGTVYTTGENTLIVELPSIRQNGDIVQNSSDFVVFYLSGTNFLMTVDAGAESARKNIRRRLGEFVERLTFRYNNSNAADATLVTLEVLLRRVVGENPETAQGSTTVILRNK